MDKQQDLPELVVLASFQVLILIHLFEEELVVEPVVQAVDCIRMGGKIILAGVKGFKAIPGFISDKLVMKEASLQGAIGVTRSGYANAIRLLEAGHHPVEKMHTHDFRLEEAELAIRTLAREIPDEESIHSCLIPEH